MSVFQCCVMCDGVMECLRPNYQLNFVVEPYLVSALSFFLTRVLVIFLRLALTGPHNLCPLSELALMTLKMGGSVFTQDLDRIFYNYTYISISL